MGSQSVYYTGPGQSECPFLANAQQLHANGHKSQYPHNLQTTTRTSFRIVTSLENMCFST